VLVQPHYAIDDMRDVRALIREYPWTLLVTATFPSLHAAHAPCLLDPEDDHGGETFELVIVGHIARADPLSADLQRGRELLLIFQGPHGYISPDWYGGGPSVPTWNFTAVHVYGIADVLEGDAAFEVLEHTVERFEEDRARPWRLRGQALSYARTIASDVVSFRLRSTRIEAKAKLSQDKPPDIQRRIIAALEEPGPYQQPRLAEEMRRAAGRHTRREGPISRRT
jgi:transcriptional regulator